ncbi:glycoside hydrolase superfamily [Auriculariales sp. MPI-PUGE-AT-0066]|nr:glycoside hydrolase superfamily [Auriculariales sp. MPI-PUGE-AT-0066]
MVLHAALAALALASLSDAKPTLGYNTYNDIACSPTAAYMSSTIDALVSKGFLAAGYNLFQIDCGWQSTDLARDSAGALKTDTTRFPSGLAPISTKARNAGFLFGLYSDAGLRACDTTVPSQRLGSLGHETADAQLFKNLSVTHLKYDNCYVDGTTSDVNAPKGARTDFVTRFTTMWNALKAVGISNYEICQWGVPFTTSSGRLQGPKDWAGGISTSFRLSDDIVGSWSHVVRIINQSIHIALSSAVGPSLNMDADLLEVGNSGFTVAEQETHFAYWAMVKSNLVISTNVAAASSDTVRILQNGGLIAINQDSAGTPVKLVQRWSGDRDLYLGSLANGDKAVIAINWQSSSRSITINFSQLGISTATVKNLWTNATTTGASSYTATVSAHGNIALRLSSVVAASTNPTVTYYQAESASLAGGAATATCAGCSGTKVGNIGTANGASFTLSGVTATSTTSTLLIDYVNAEVGYMGATNARGATISVNGGTAVAVSFPLSGYDWSYDVLKGFRVELSGFRVASNNTITYKAGDTEWAPDIDRIGVIQ